jgi:hypothetical protein
MKKIAAIALGLSLVSSAVVAQTTTAPAVPTDGAPEVVIAGGIGAGGIVLGALGLLLLAGLGGRNNPGDGGGDGGGSSSSSSSSSSTGS